MSPGEIVVYDSLMGSNIKKPEKSIIKEWFDKVTGGEITRYRNSSINTDHAITLMQMLRSNLESGATSFALGAIHADIGLDVPIPFTKMKVPMDLGLWASSNLVSILLSGHEVSRDFMNVGMAGENSYLFRKGYDWIAAKKQAKGAVPAGNIKNTATVAGDSDDPIQQVAKTL